MELLTRKDFDDFAIVWQMAYGVDNPKVVELLARLEATKEYLSRVEFAESDDIKTARDTYCWSDDSGIQIDDDARVSYGDNVIWIGAWVLIGGRGPGE